MYSVESGRIIPNILYKVIGDKNVVYNDREYLVGELFRGINGVKEFVFMGNGVGLLTEISEIKAGTLLFKQTPDDLLIPVDATGISGMAIQFKLTEAEKVVNEDTKLQGMGINFKDSPFCTYFINETRFSFNPD
ncbi:hypothetical protein DBR40_21555 [Pedobacter sp. KBW01]|uniref:hypothetical protein n=1 Tax=Pedobacter sp. KBW01 TaxID=2153364 RepID=UPI000F59C724|nr:hypothetical protein [Pedobacter sp. KBW01]RQO66842.1 hypothetical protein DBR40_21555 [Pedobacter sp. KBW01]